MRDEWRALRAMSAERRASSTRSTCPTAAAVRVGASTILATTRSPCLAAPRGIRNQDTIAQTREFVGNHTTPRPRVLEPSGDFVRAALEHFEAPAPERLAACHHLR